MSHRQVTQWSLALNVTSVSFSTHAAKSEVFPLATVFGPSTALEEILVKVILGRTHQTTMIPKHGAGYIAYLWRVKQN